MPPFLYADPIYLEHQTGEGHPESPERLRTIYARLEQSPVLARYQTAENGPASEETLGLVHSPDYLALLKDRAARGGGQVEADTVISQRSYAVACQAAGAAVHAVDAILSGETSRALCLTRPPGHHALADAPMGFCLFNHVAVAAAHARHRHHLERVLIVDWDVHHGNGTQDLFYDSEAVHYVSVHRAPFYPGTGAASETGTGAGLGTTYNLPLPFGIRRPELLSQFERLLSDAAARCQPDLVLLSAGFDAHAADPIGSLGLETEDFAPLTRLVVQVATQYCDGKLVSLLEGGYHPQMLAESVECHMQALLP